MFRKREKQLEDELKNPSYSNYLVEEHIYQECKKEYNDIAKFLQDHEEERQYLINRIVNNSNPEEYLFSLFKKFPNLIIALNTDNPKVMHFFKEKILDPILENLKNDPIKTLEELLAQHKIAFLRTMIPEILKTVLPNLINTEQRGKFLLILVNLFTDINPHYYSEEAPCDNPVNISLVTKNLKRMIQEQKDEKEAVKLPYKQIAFFTRVFEDGFGDAFHCYQHANIFAKTYPETKIIIYMFIDAFKKREQTLRTIIQHDIHPTIEYYFLDSGFQNEKRVDPDKIRSELARLEGLELFPLINPSIVTRGPPKPRHLAKTDLIIQNSFKIPELKAILNSLNINCPIYFWGEPSQRTHIPGKEQYTLLDRPGPADLSASRLRIGDELGVRQQAGAQRAEQHLQEVRQSDPTWGTLRPYEQLERCAALFKNEQFKKIILEHFYYEREYQPYLYYAYMRTQKNLLVFCALIQKMHAGKSDIVNLFVKNIPSDDSIRLGNLNNFIIIQQSEDGTLQIKQKITDPGQPIIRFINMRLEFADANLVAAMSPIKASGGDTSNFQALSTYSLPFIEKFDFDGVFYRYIIFLAEKYLGKDSDLASYLSLTFTLTSIGNLKQLFQTFYPDAMSHYLDDLHIIIKRGKVQDQYRQFVEQLRANHNEEFFLKNFHVWHDKNPWIPHPKWRDEYTQSYLQFFECRPKSPVSFLFPATPEIDERSFDLPALNPPKKISEADDTSSLDPPPLIRPSSIPRSS